VGRGFGPALLFVLLMLAVRVVRPVQRETLTNEPVAEVNFADRAGRDLIIVGLAIMTISLFILTCAAVIVGHIGIWQPSENFPKNIIQPFIWSLSALLVHGCAILTADRMRARFVRNERWFRRVGHERRPNAANYIRVALGCALTGYVALYLWGLIFHQPTIGLAKDTAPFALLPATTGAFYGYHLDNVELGRRPWRLWEISLQTLVTALCGLVATSVWLTLDGADVASNVDFIALVTLFGAVVGASLAWYLPKAAESPRYDPMVEARKARIKMLEATALERFGKANLADQWLARPNPSLGDRTPRDAAAEIELFPNAWALTRAACSRSRIGATQWPMRDCRRTPILQACRMIPARFVRPYN
jgi:hypothetical protein